ncbi:tRNA (cytosine(38)-C(5))-methyltransferase isoform X2 [Pieris brassicae]|uniref:tRNA (cytosine(38)-C(5))-methyltransferase isoform X2 n=1 Tax=Pieris brassicae TaxID=7116 RepID=UPI001E660A98|nr:tRNA (cytosine(38)-C(5))-methyltransferase isoform X2 [Pieris brassicae]
MFMLLLSKPLSHYIEAILILDIYKMKHKILELYSGIGGMHCAWKDSGLDGDIIAAIDINTVANEVYRENFPNTYQITKNIQSLTVSEINKLEVDTILMSPPCQPFTRNGKYLDDSDPRTNSFLYIINILKELVNIENILMENVKGFECSKVRNLFIDKLKECNFDYQEFLLCPSQIGVPNSRLRYYCLARKKSTKWQYKRKDEIISEPPFESKSLFPLRDIMEKTVPEAYYLNDKVLKWGKVLDICYKDSRRSCCFTKAYSHYVDGTGSVFTEKSPEFVKQCYSEANKFDIGSDEYIEKLKELNLRYFTPKEVLAIMMFPKEYIIPDVTTMKQSYRLIGNSVNVKVITELLKVLFM